MTEQQVAPTQPVDPGPPPDPDSDPRLANPAALQGEDDFAGFDNYWGTDETKRVYLKDGQQWFEIKKLDEGEKSKFQKMTSKDLILQQKTGDARMSVDQAEERHQLIKASVTGWYLMQLTPGADPKKRSSWSEAPWGGRALDNWLMKADPAAVEKLETEIRIFNPWLQGEMTVEDIDEEMDRLTDLKKSIIEREAGEGASANK